MEIIYHKIEDFVKLENDWNLLAKPFNNPMVTIDWFISCIEHFHLNDELFIFCMFDNENLIAAAPLYKNRTQNKLKVIGNDVLYEPTSFLYKNDMALKNLIKFILRSKLPAELNRLPILYNNHISSIKSLKYIFMRTIETKGSQYLKNIPSYEDFMSSLSTKRKSDLRRSSRKLNDIGDHRFDIYRPTRLEIPQFLEQAFEIEHNSWKGINNSSILANENLKDFISDIFTHFSNGNSLIGLLYSNDKAIACNLSIVISNTLWIIKIGYDNNYSKISPGVLLTHNIIKYCCDNNISNIEFLGSTENWINAWRPDERKYITFLYYPVSYIGLKSLINDSISILKMKTRNMLT